LANFIKERKLKGITTILFKNGRLLLNLILCSCSIDINYSIFFERINTQIIILTTIAEGTTGFTLVWFFVSVLIVADPLLTLIIFLRGLMQ